MPSWKKVVTSGSNAAIPSVSSTGDFTIDAGGDIVLDADGADILLKDGGTHFGSLKRVTSDLVIKSETQDKDIVFKGNDGGSTITAMTIDMSAGGTTTFAGSQNIYSDGNVAIGATKGLYFDGGTHTYIHEASSDKLRFTIGGSTAVDFTSTTANFSGYVSGSALVSKQTAASMSGANNVDLSTSANHNITITGNITLTPTNFSGRRGQSGIITLIQDSSGGHSITLNSLFKTPRGDSIAFDTTADGISLMSYYVIDASNVAVNYLGPFS